MIDLLTSKLSKVILSLIFFSGLLISILKYFETGIQYPELAHQLPVAAAVLGIIALLYQSKTLKSKTNLYLIGAFLIIAGAGYLFKIQHWPKGLEIVVSGVTGALFVYLFNFYRRTSKQFTDWLKLTFLMTYFAGFLFTVYHIPGSAPVFLISVFAFWLLCLISWINLFFRRMGDFS